MLAGVKQVTIDPQPGRILVVDDSALNRDLLLRHLDHAGHQVEMAENGVEALERLRTGAFDLMLLDIMMPKLDGFGVLEAMRTDERLSFTPVLVISAVSDSASVVRCIELGAQDHVSKPFDPVVLRARVNACLERKRLHDSEQRSLRQLEREKKQVQNLLQVVVPIGVALAAEPDFASLLEKMLMGGKRLCNADGGTLYLRTSADTLEYVIVQNDTLNIAFSVADEKPPLFTPIHLYTEGSQPQDQEHAAAHVVLNGKTINMSREAERDRFPGTEAFDALAGYQTVSLLTLPLISSKGQVIGALQYVNARDDVTGETTTFSNNLQQLLEALASLAAAALDGYLREASLKQMIEELRVKVVVNDSARRAEVDRVTESDFFVRLRAYIEETRTQGA
jgi:DNA-binding response OmpR family regulator